MKFTKNDLNENYAIIAEFCKYYRNELTVFGAFIGEDAGLVNHKDYIEFLDSLSFDAFVGNYLTNLLVPDSIDLYKKVLNDGIDIWEAFESVDYFGFCHIIKEVKKYLSK